VIGTPTSRPFRIDAALLGGRVAIDGVDVSDGLLGWELIGGAPDRPTRLLLHVAGEGVVTGEGIVETILDAPSGDQVRALDASKIRAAFAARSQGLGESAAAVYRDVIADMLDQAGP